MVGRVLPDVRVACEATVTRAKWDSREELLLRLLSCFSRARLCATP